MRIERKKAEKNQRKPKENILTSKVTSGNLAIDGAFQILQCQTLHIQDAGDHIVIIGEVIASEMKQDFSPLLYFSGDYCDVNKLILLKKSSLHGITGSIPSALFLLTALLHDLDSNPLGSCVTSIACCSLQPPLLSLVIHEATSIFNFFKAGSKALEFAVNVLHKVKEVLYEEFMLP